MKKLTGLTSRQIDSWRRLGIFTPSLQDASGKGTRAVYSTEDAFVGQVIGELRRLGAPLEALKAIGARVRKLNIEELEIGEYLFVNEGLAQVLSANQVESFFRKPRTGMWVLPWAALQNETTQADRG